MYYNTQFEIMFEINSYILIGVLDFMHLNTRCMSLLLFISLTFLNRGFCSTKTVPAGSPETYQSTQFCGFETQFRSILGSVCDQRECPFNICTKSPTGGLFLTNETDGTIISRNVTYLVDSGICSGNYVNNSVTKNYPCGWKGKTDEKGSKLITMQIGLPALPFLDGYVISAEYYSDLECQSLYQIDQFLIEACIHLIEPPPLNTNASMKAHADGTMSAYRSIDCTGQALLLPLVPSSSATATSGSCQQLTGPSPGCALANVGCIVKSGKIYIYGTSNSDSSRSSLSDGFIAMIIILSFFFITLITFLICKFAYPFLGQTGLLIKGQHASSSPVETKK